jgi:hypothetical protein
MTFLQEIALQHNECIVQLSDSNLMQSYHILQGIVTILRLHVTEVTSSTPNTSWAVRPKLESISSKVETDGIYDRPLLLVWNKSSTSDKEEPWMRLFSATVLFNLGLVCHRMGNLYGSERSLTIATKMYLVVKELMQDIAFKSCRPALLLLLLAIHNLGHLQNSLYNYPAYYRCMEALWRLVPQMSLTDDPIEHHLLCSLRMWLSVGPPSAAAA